MLQHLNPVDANEILLINITLVKVFINVLCISYAIAHSYTKRKKYVSTTKTISFFRCSTAHNTRVQIGLLWFSCLYLFSTRHCILIRNTKHNRGKQGEYLHSLLKTRKRNKFLLVYMQSIYQRFRNFLFAADGLSLEKQTLKCQKGCTFTRTAQQQESNGCKR